MQLATCFLVATERHVDSGLDKLHLKSLKLVQSIGKRRVLPEGIDPLEVYDGWADGDVEEEPSYEVSDCLVSARGWGFFESNFSVIIVGVPENVKKLKPILAKPFDEWHLSTRGIDWEYATPPSWHADLKIYKAPDYLDWWGRYHYAELLARDLREGNTHIVGYPKPTLWDQVQAIDAARAVEYVDQQVIKEFSKTKKDWVTASPQQIKMILRSVPHVFPEDWKNSETLQKEEGLSRDQKVVFRWTSPLGIWGISPQTIQWIIEYAVQYRDQYCRKEAKMTGNGG